MQSVPPNRGEMSQDFSQGGLHPSVVTSRRSIDPAAQAGRRAYDALSASSVGLELGISVVLGLLFGRYLDTKLGTEPWMMLLFLVLGLVAGFRGMLRSVARAERSAARTDEASRG